MSSKRKRVPAKKAPNKRKSRKQSESDDYESDMSDGSAGPNLMSGPQADEVLIAGHGDELDPPSKLPAELLKSMERDGGHLVIAGLVDWEMTGRREKKKGVGQQRPNLNSFQRFTDTKYRYIASGCSSPHSILVAEDGKAMALGRNQYGQLGTGDLLTKDLPTPVPALAEMNIIQAATGRNHTLFLTDTGTVYGCGDNRNGQCGVGSTAPMVQTPTRINYRGPPIIKIGCGAEFSVILDVKGGLHSFGCPEYGQLGHNTDGKYFVTSTKMGFHSESSPKRVVLYIEKSKDGHVTPVDAAMIVDFSCGNNHTVAIDSQKRAYSWGFGGFGRLGHAEQKDEMVPRLIKYFDSQSRGVRSIVCGAAFSLAITDLGTLFLFGQNKKTGEANMYPKPVQDLAGWNITCIGASNTSIMISADDSLIAWGGSPTYGELGLGDLQKSSATPKEVTKFEGMKIPQIAMGLSHTMMLVNTTHELTKEKYDKLPVFEP